MKELKIYEFQAKQIEYTFRMIVNVLDSHKKTTCLDRDIMVSWQMIKNIIECKPDEHVER